MFATVPGTYIGASAGVGIGFGMEFGAFTGSGLRLCTLRLGSGDSFHGSLALNRIVIEEARPVFRKSSLARKLADADLDSPVSVVEEIEEAFLLVDNSNITRFFDGLPENSLESWNALDSDLPPDIYMGVSRQRPICVLGVKTENSVLNESGKIALHFSSGGAKPSLRWWTHSTGTNLRGELFSVDGDRAGILACKFPHWFAAPTFQMVVRAMGEGAEIYASGI